MLSANLSLRANKSQAYFDSLCKHFARKVEVTREGNQASVAFPLGSCRMSVENGALQFVVNARDTSSLDIVKMIISTHVVRFSEINAADVNWCLEDSLEAGVRL